MAEIGGLVLSPLLQLLFDKLLSHEFADLFRGRQLDQDLLRDLKMALISVNKLVEDAEDRGLVETPVKDWVDELKDAVYDAGDILDAIATKALKRKLDAEFEGTVRKVRNFISDFLRPLAKKVEPKIKQILCKLNDLAKRKDDLGLRDLGGGTERRFSTSLVEESDTFGRNGDKEKITNLLLSNDASGNDKMRVIAIVGMGGIGKTTLAQLVYNDKMVEGNFDLKAWVCISEDFNVARVTKTILEEIGLPTNEGSENLNGLQLTLLEGLRENKFLIVFDDMWDESPSKWEELSKPFKSGAQGSAVIVTTRNDSVASIVRADPSYPLNRLSNVDSWSLFVKQAFGNNESNMRPQLEVIGKQIVKKCGGLPLAVKAIGCLLRGNLEADEWKKILESSIWDSPHGKTEIHPSLRLSYKYLPPDLKRCFAYCAMFFENCIFVKEYITLLWMAEGLLKETTSKTMEEVGYEYFLALTSRSFFEKYRGKVRCRGSGDFGHVGLVMHDLVNDMARSISGEFMGRGVDHLPQITVKTRHLALSREEIVKVKNSKELYKAKRLHTFFLAAPWKNEYITNADLCELFPMMTWLRVLSLRSCINVTVLPNSIVKMKYLRYLDLSGTEITKLSKSVCKLCNLQTLNLARCTKLVALPKEMRRLVKLCYLNIKGTNIKELPIEVAQLHTFVGNIYCMACI